MIRGSTFLVSLWAICGVAAAQNWPSFRGPNGSGVADGQNPPTTWNAEKGENIRWKTPIAGLGHSCPVIWGDRIFLTSAISGDPNAGIKAGQYGDVAPVNDDSKHSWHVLALDVKSGKIVWDQTACEGVPKIKRHTKATHANSTTATDGKHVVACFGAEGLYCYDMDGKLLWKKDLGLLDSGWYPMPAMQWGFGSSPIIYKDVIFLQCDVQKDSFIAAYDVKDGRQIWSTPRNDKPSWSTPIIHEAPGRTELIVNGYEHMGGYDPQTGKELWKLAGGGDIPIPTPVVAHGMIFFTSSHTAMVPKYPPAPVFAVKLGASGDITPKTGETKSDYVVWSKERRASYMPSPLVYGEYLYIGNDSGILTCYNAKTGEQLYRERIGEGKSGFTASPVAADGRIYFNGEDGDTYVVQAGPEFKLLAANSVGETCLSTPAIAQGMYFIRGQKHLFGIGAAGR